MQMTTSTNAYVGIDIAKDKFDVHLLVSKDVCFSGKFDNGPKGWSDLVKWTAKQAPDVRCHYILEPTGSYGTGLLHMLAGQGHLVSQVNAYHAKQFARSQGRCNKTDKIDALTLAQFGRERAPEAYVLPSEARRELTETNRYLDALKSDLQALRNQLGQPRTSATVKKSLSARITETQRHVDQIKKDIETLADESVELREDFALLMSIEGIGLTTAASILAEMPEMSTLADAQSLPAYAGLNPALIQSGKFCGATHISRRGSWRLRKAMYFAAMTAMRCNTFAIALAERLTARGMAKMAVMAAVMRKLLLIAYGVLKGRKPFDQDYKPTFPAGGGRAPCAA